MINPRISIVTPCYNAEEYLEETIVSVLDQNYPNLQYIIIDGGSQDRSPEIIKKYEHHLDYWISERDNGQSHAISKGFQCCDGEVFNWLNADDTYTSSALAEVGQAFSNPTTNVLLGRSRKYGVGHEYISQGTDVFSNNLEKTIGRARIDQPETFFRKALINQIDGINLSLHYLMDRELWIRYLLRFGLTGIQLSDKILVNFRHHPKSKTISNPMGFYDEDAKLANWILSWDKEIVGILEAPKKKILPPATLNIRKVKFELCASHFEEAYALRNWREMDKWSSAAFRYAANPTEVLSILHLNARSAFLRKARLLQQILRLARI